MPLARPMRVLVLWTYDSPSTRRICAAVHEQAPAMGLTPIVLQCRDEAVVAAVAMGWDRVLAEGYLDGPDVAVESIVLDGVTHHVSIAQSGWYGHCWQAATPMAPALERHREAIGAAVAAANSALGVRWAATSHEVRVTAHGPVLVEAN